MADRCPICTKRHKDKPWLALLDGREPDENMRAIGYRRHHHTGLALMGSHPMPDDDGVLRCVTCLQAWNGRRGALVTGYELMCCGQEWVPERAMRATLADFPLPDGVLAAYQDGSVLREGWGCPACSEWSIRRGANFGVRWHFIDHAQGCVAPETEPVPMWARVSGDGYLVGLLKTKPDDLSFAAVRAVEVRL